MRENRTYGSEGGAAEPNRPFLPLSMELQGSRTVRWDDRNAPHASSQRASSSVGKTRVPVFVLIS